MRVLAGVVAGVLAAGLLLVLVAVGLLAFSRQKPLPLCRHGGGEFTWAGVRMCAACFTELV